jgi:uncharacterized membrane protein
MWVIMVFILFLLLIVFVAILAILIWCCAQSFHQEHSPVSSEASRPASEDETREDETN